MNSWKSISPLPSSSTSPSTGYCVKVVTVEVVIAELGQHQFSICRNQSTVSVQKSAWLRPPRLRPHACGTEAMRSWRNAVDIILLEILSSMKPYPSVVHAHVDHMRLVTYLFEPKQLDEVSSLIPPTSQARASGDLSSRAAEASRLMFVSITARLFLVLSVFIISNRKISN